MRSLLVLDDRRGAQLHRLPAGGGERGVRQRREGLRDVAPLQLLAAAAGEAQCGGVGVEDAVLPVERDEGLADVFEQRSRS